MTQELGPSLGRLTDPPAPAAGDRLVPLDDVRLSMISELFELGAGERLDGHRWLAVWDKAVAAAAARIAEAVNHELKATASEVRLPRRRADRLLIDSEEQQAMAARIGIPGTDFVTALDAMAEAETVQQRRDAMMAAARRLESAWQGVERAALAEEGAWQIEVRRVRRWRPARWPLWIISALVV
ncbi:MAG TPA: hypothetical protein VFL95_07725, partial [Gemmatimonadales bacterium]|nr:hypothetical protein [Gemmatimonadales bacterium]